MRHCDAAPVLALDAAVSTTSLTPSAALAGWRSVALGADGAWPDDDPPTLIVATGTRAGMLARRRDALAPAAGVIAVAAAPVAEADETMAPMGAMPAFGALLARWRPQPLPDAVGRQIAVFGADHLQPLLARLRERLVATLVVDVAQAHAAHQLAGFAGILGFADVAADWEAVSRDGESALPDARRAARRAVAALDRSGLCGTSH